MMEFTAEMIAGFLGGDIVGDKTVKVHTVSSIEEGKAGSMAYLVNPKYEPFLYTTEASIVLVDRSFTPQREVKPTLVKVDDAGAAVLRLLCADKSNAEIAQMMDIKLPTVKTHVSHIFDKLGVKRRSEAKTAAEKLWLVANH